MYARRSRRKDKGVGASNGHSSWVSDLHQAIDDLNVTRASVREEALSIIVTTLARHYAAAELRQRHEELVLLLRRSLSKGTTARESALAAHAISLSFISQGNLERVDQEELYQRILPALKYTAENTTDTDVKCKSLYALGVITLTAASDIDAQLARDYIYEWIESEGQDIDSDEADQHLLTKACLRAYGIIFISSFCQGMIDPGIVWEEIEKVMPLHELLLESQDKDVRIAAGQNIAVMFETLRICNQKITTTKDEEEENNQPTEIPEYDNMDGLLHTLSELSLDSNSSQDYDHGDDPNLIFQNVLETVEEGVQPVEEVSINGTLVQVKGWAKLLILKSFREIIGRDLQIHLKANDIFRQIFHYSIPLSEEESDEDDGPSMSELSKADRMFLINENKKLRTRQIREARLRKDIED